MYALTLAQGTLLWPTRITCGHREAYDQPQHKDRTVSHQTNRHSIPTLLLDEGLGPP